MKKIFQLLALSALAFAATSCDPFEGVLKVKTALTIVDNSNSTYQIPVGEQNAKLEFLSRDRIRIKTQISGKDEKITMNLPKNLNLPENGNFLISAVELGQSFSIQGSIATTRSDSQMFRGYESCQYTRYDVECNPSGCYQVPRTVNGQQYVEYFNRVTNQNINVSFDAVKVLAIYKGSKSSSEKIFLSKGQCF